MWTCWCSADFKTQIKENSPAHVAVAKIVKELDDRKIKLRKAFKLLDRDKDGTISVEDLPKVRVVSLYSSVLMHQRTSPAAILYERWMAV